MNHYDVVIAANVLHATKSIRRTLQNTKATLRKSGLIVLNEISRKSLFAHLTFGLLKGWWLTEDNQYRIPGSPGLYPKAWQQVLEEEGFNSVLFPAEAVHELGLQIILAESDGIIRQKWPLNAEANPLKRKGPQTAVAEESYPQSRLDKTGVLVAEEKLREKSTRYFKKLIGETLKMESHKIDSSEPLENYGIDSILVVQITNRLRDVFEDVSSTLLFEVQTIDALADHFIKTQKNSLTRLLGLDNQNLDGKNMSLEKMEADRISDTSQNRPRVANRFLRFRDSKMNEISKLVRDPIAIVGMSGRYPQAKNLEEYWKNLEVGKDCITEIPEDRWSLEGFFCSNLQEAVTQGKSYSKWGGFVKALPNLIRYFFPYLSSGSDEHRPAGTSVFLQCSWEVIRGCGLYQETNPDAGV